LHKKLKVFWHPEKQKVFRGFWHAENEKRFRAFWRFIRFIDSAYLSLNRNSREIKKSYPIRTLPLQILHPYSRRQSAQTTAPQTPHERRKAAFPQDWHAPFLSGI